MEKAGEGIKWRRLWDGLPVIYHVFPFWVIFLPKNRAVVERCFCFLRQVFGLDSWLFLGFFGASSHSYVCLKPIPFGGRLSLPMLRL